MTGRRILVAFHVLARREAAFLQPLRDAGFELEFNELGRRFTEDELIARLKGVCAVIAADEPYTERVFASCPDLKVVARFGVGFNSVDVEAATRHGVPVAMAFGTNHESVADYAFGMAMALSLDLLRHHRTVAEGRWGGGFHPGFWGKTVGIVGLGRIGKAMARRCEPFGTVLLAHDIAPDEVFAIQHGVAFTSLEDLLRESDIVSIHTPLDDGTRNLIGARELALMKPTAFLVSTARGGIIDEAALNDALGHRRIAGVGLDVFVDEPPLGSPLLARDNLILSPHIAGVDENAERLMGERCVANILAVLEGKDPGEGFVLNPGVTQ